MANNFFERIWDEVLKEDNIEESIKLHLKEHNAFLQLIQQYVGSFRDKGVLNVLEAGCGTAIDSYYIARHTNANVWAIDISNKAIQVAEKVGGYFNKINLKVADITKTDFEDGFFDVIFSQGTLEHLQYPIPAMEEQTRILCDGGYLIVSVPQKYNIYTIFRKLLSIIGKWPYGWERGYSIFELGRLGNRMGLKIVETMAWGLTCELSKSKRPHIAIFGRLYNFIMQIFYKLFRRFAIYFLQDICVVFALPR